MQRRSAQPLVDPKRCSRTGPFAAGCAIVGLQNLAMYALLFQLPYLLDLLYQWPDRSRSGHYMTAFMVSMMGASLVGGRVAEKAGVLGDVPVRIAARGGGLCAGFRCWRRARTRSTSSAALVLGGAGLGLANGPSQSAAIGERGSRDERPRLRRAVHLPLPRRRRRHLVACAACCRRRRLRLRLPTTTRRSSSLPSRWCSRPSPRRAFPRGARTPDGWPRRRCGTLFDPTCPRSRRRPRPGCSLEAPGRVAARRRQPLAVVEFCVLRAGRNGRCGAAAVPRDRVPRVRLCKAPVAHLDRAPAF